MKYELLRTIMSDIKNGTFMRVTYKSDVNIKSAYKKAGYEVIKFVETTTRTGISYGSVKNNNVIPTSTKANNYEWDMVNKIRYNTNTEKHYIFVAPIAKGNNTNTRYFVKLNGTVVYQTNSKQKLIDKYENMLYASNGGFPTVQNIAIDNIISINGIK